MSTCPLSISQADYERLQEAEAVVISEYESADKQRFAKLVFIGSRSECEDLVNTPGMLIIPTGVTYICHAVVAVEDLIPLDNAVPNRGE